MAKGVYERPYPSDIVVKTDQIEANGVSYDLKPLFIYFVEDVRWDYIKIGSAVDPMRRFSGLSTGAPDCLRMIGLARGTARHEKDLRLYLRELRHKGEWFSRSPELMSFVDRLPSLTEYMDGATVPEMAECPDFMFRLYQLGYSFEQIGEFFGQTKQNASNQINIRTKDRWPKGRAPLTEPTIQESYAKILAQHPMLALSE